MVPAWLLNLTAEELDGLKWYSNRNLLDNPDFSNPVNQRGVSAGTAGWNDTWIDRWLGNCTYNIKSGYISFAADGYCVQRSKNPFVFPVTMSILTTNGLLHATFTSPGAIAIDGYGWLEIQNGEANYVCYRNLVDVDVKAVKLERGTRQTLAHLENGVWVQNEVIDYEEQLRRCQYYSRFFGYDIEIPCSNNPDGKHIEGTLPLTMRSGNGSISYSEGFLFFGDRLFYSVSGANVSSNGGRVKIGANISSQLQSNLQATLYLRNCSISFDL